MRRSLIRGRNEHLLNTYLRMCRLNNLVWGGGAGARCERVLGVVESKTRGNGRFRMGKYSGIRWHETSYLWILRQWLRSVATYDSKPQCAGWPRPRPTPCWLYIGPCLVVSPATMLAFIPYPAGLRGYTERVDILPCYLEVCM